MNALLIDQNDHVEQLDSRMLDGRESAYREHYKNKSYSLPAVEKPGPNYFLVGGPYENYS